jgi:hypothetical protein
VEIDLEDVILKLALGFVVFLVLLLTRIVFLLLSVIIISITCQFSISRADLTAIRCYLTACARVEGLLSAFAEGTLSRHF